MWSATTNTAGTLALISHCINLRGKHNTTRHILIVAILLTALLQTNRNSAPTASIQQLWPTDHSIEAKQSCLLRLRNVEVDPSAGSCRAPQRKLTHPTPLLVLLPTGKLTYSAPVPVLLSSGKLVYPAPILALLSSGKLVYTAPPLVLLSPGKLVHPAPHLDWLSSGKLEYPAPLLVLLSSGKLVHPAPLRTLLSSDKLVHPAPILTWLSPGKLVYAPRFYKLPPPDAPTPHNLLSPRGQWHTPLHHPSFLGEQPHIAPPPTLTKIHILQPCTCPVHGSGDPRPWPGADKHTPTCRAAPGASHAGEARLRAILNNTTYINKTMRGALLTGTPYRGSTSTAQHSSQRRVDARFADIPATALSGCTEGQLVEAALLGHIVKTVLNCPGGQLPNLMYSTSPEATAVRIQLWLEEKNIEGASTVTHCPMRHFSLGQTGYTCHPYQYNVKLPPASISRFLEAYETDPPLTDIATEKGVVQGRMQCTLLEEHPRNSSHTMRVQAHLQLLPGADCLGIWPPEHMQGAHTPQAIRQVMHILGCVLALSDMGAPPGSLEAWRAYAARVPLSSLRLMQALSVNAVTQERGQQAGAYTAHSTTPALREMLTACHSLVFELEGILTLRLSAASPPPLPPHCIAIGKPTGGPVSPSELCDVLWALHDAHHPPDAVAPLVSAQSAEGQRLRDMLAQGATLPLSFANFAGDMLTMKQHGSSKMLLTTIKDPLTDQVIANEHPLGTVARAITACCTPNGLPLSSHGVREAPILYLTPASKQAMVSALAAAQDLGGVVETQRGQVWIGVPRSLAGVSGGINLPIWLKEVGTPVDAADPATRARTASRNTRYTGLQHVPDQAALTFRAIAAVTDGITMQQVVGANAAYELQGRATTYLVEARVVDHSDAKYTPAVLRALTHEGSTQPTPQPAATSRGWGTRAVAVATQLQAAPPRNTTATTAPIPPTGGAAARAPGRGGAGGRGRGPNSVPDPSGRGTSRGPSPNLMRSASSGAWAGRGTSSRASSDSSIAAFDELAIEAGFLYTAQAPTNETGGNDGATLENNATLVDPLPHTTGDNDPSGGADTTQEGATQRDLAGSSGIQRAGGRTQVHSPALTPGAERAARRQRHGSSGGGRGLNLSYISKMDSVSAEDHNPGGSPMEEEQEEMPKEGTKTAETGPSN